MAVGNIVKERCLLNTHQWSRARHTYVCMCPCPCLFLVSPSLVNYQLPPPPLPASPEFRSIMCVTSHTSHAYLVWSFTNDLAVVYDTHVHNIIVVHTVDVRLSHKSYESTRRHITTAFPSVVPLQHTVAPPNTPSFFLEKNNSIPLRLTARTRFLGFILSEDTRGHVHASTVTFRKPPEREEGRTGGRRRSELPRGRGFPGLQPSALARKRHMALHLTSIPYRVYIYSTPPA